MTMTSIYFIMSGGRDIGQEFQELWAGSPTSTADEIWRLMNQLTFVVAVDRMNEVAEALGLNRTQARLLMQLRPGASISQKGAAGMLHCDPSNVTILADRLETLKLLRREVDLTDRRGRALTLTAKGKRVRQELIDRVFAVPDALSSLPDPEQHTLRDLLQRLVASV
jgi:DNA-binding MarR family transcriptional regulator